MLYNISKHVRALFILCGMILIGHVPLTLSAQIHKAPADTGKIQWGHVNFTPYRYPAMCDRAGREFVRYYSRSYIPDTSLAAMLDSSGGTVSVPEEGKEAVQECLAQYSERDVPSEQLWGYIRSALLLSEDDKAVAGIERLIREAPDSTLREDVYTTAIASFLMNSPRRIDLVSRYLDRLDKLSEIPPAGSIAMRNLIVSYWQTRYFRDSVHKYAQQSIDIIKRMPFELREKVNAPFPYGALISMANDAGNLQEQQQWLDSMEAAVGEWGGGRGRMAISNMQQALDFRKSLYGKRANPITEGHWFNTKGQSWPVAGKVSMIVLINHLCMYECVSQYKTIKRLKRIFGDDLHITLLTQSAGYSIGTFVLNEQQEGDSIVSLFSTVYDMPYAVLLDPRPTSKLPDGRIIRGPGPIAELFEEWRGYNTILTDKHGRIQWLGSLSSEKDRRRMINTIRRLAAINN